MVSYEQIMRLEQCGSQRITSIPIFDPEEEFNHYDNHSEFEMLLGKEKVIFNHPGNKRFRAIINHNVDRYMSTSTKSGKTKLVRKIYCDMKQAGYRFLKRADKLSSVWNDIKEADAHEKISHALRDRVREIRKPFRKKSVDEISPLITAMARVIQQNNDTALAMKQLECLRKSVATTSSRQDQGTLYDPCKITSNSETEYPSISQGFPSQTNTLNKGAENSQLLRIEHKRRISLLEMDDSFSRISSPCRSSSISSMCQAKATNNHTRRSSLESLFGGLADTIADVPNDISTRRNSLFPVDNLRMNDNLPLRCVSLPESAESSKHVRVSQEEELSMLGRRLSLIDGLGQNHNERRLSILSSLSGFTF
mmetsp:Transcript_27019/g.40891  ORF Transcript_27019/g.40891 Transcript_27019/m.40891 type:complete len:366 (+) Transcript_27019:216-1313(+)